MLVVCFRPPAGPTATFFERVGGTASSSTRGWKRFVLTSLSYCFEVP